MHGYELCLKHLIKLLLALEYYYARWCTIYLIELIQLDINCLVIPSFKKQKKNNSSSGP